MKVIPLERGNEKMRFKVGDVVKVRKWEDLVEQYGKDSDGVFNADKEWNFSESMSQLCGEVVIITSIFGNLYYTIKEDAGNWTWQDWMFEDVEVKSTSVLDTIVIREVMIEPMEYVLSLLEGETKSPHLYPHNIRELALARTKLQEALFWMNEAYNKQSEEEAK
jgi:hypothetical protein